jgi:hypothetical protein
VRKGKNWKSVSELNGFTIPNSYENSKLELFKSNHFLAIKHYFAFFSEQPSEVHLVVEARYITAVGHTAAEEADNEFLQQGAAIVLGTISKQGFFEFLREKAFGKNV